MSDDYLSRLRAELLRAGAAQAPRRRRVRAIPRLGPLVAVAAVALLVATAALIVPGERRDEVPAQDPREVVTFTYLLPTGDVDAAAGIMRERLAAAGVAAEVVVRDRTLAITAPNASRSAVAALTAPGRLAIHDWERSVLGPDGRPAPTSYAVTGGPAAGQQAELTEPEARARAAKRSGARAVEAERGWFALADNAALTNADVASVRAGKDDRGTPVVELEFTPAGEHAFSTLTRELAERGADQAAGGDPLQTSQHLAFIVDDRLVSTPFIHWRDVPNGIDGAEGAYIIGFPSAEQTRWAAALLSAGPLPAGLQPVTG